MKKETAIRVALKYLARTEEEKGEKQEVLSEDQIKAIAKDTLERYYPATVHALLRQQPIEELLFSSLYAVRNFHRTDVPKEKLDSFLVKIRTRLLNTVREIAFEDTYSLTEKIVDELRNQRNLTEDDIDSYVRTLLLDIKRQSNKFVNFVRSKIDMDV